MYTCLFCCFEVQVYFLLFLPCFPLLSPDLLCPSSFLSSSSLLNSLFVCLLYSPYFAPFPSGLSSHLIHQPISSFPLTTHLPVCPLLYILSLHLLAFPIITSSPFLPCALVSSLPFLISFTRGSYLLLSPSLIGKNFLSPFLGFKIWIMNGNSTVVLTETSLKSQPD